MNEQTLTTGYSHPHGPVADAFERRVRAREEASLSPLATRSYPALRTRPEPTVGCGRRFSATATGSSTARRSGG